MIVAQSSLSLDGENFLTKAVSSCLLVHYDIMLNMLTNRSQYIQAIMFRIVTYLLPSIAIAPYKRHSPTRSRTH